MRVELEVPYPPSANRYWRHNRGRTHVSTEAAAYRKAVGLLGRAAGIRPVTGEVEVELNVHRPAKRGDLDNTLKILIDALRGIAYEDDKQIIGIQIRRFDGIRPPGVRVVVKS